MPQPWRRTSRDQGRSVVNNKAAFGPDTVVLSIISIGCGLALSGNRVATVSVMQKQYTNSVYDHGLFHYTSAVYIIDHEA